MWPIFSPVEGLNDMMIKTGSWSGPCDDLLFCWYRQIMIQCFLCLIKSNVIIVLFFCIQSCFFKGCLVFKMRFFFTMYCKAPINKIINILLMQLLLKNKWTFQKMRMALVCAKNLNTPKKKKKSWYLDQWKWLNLRISVFNMENSDS